MTADEKMIDYLKSHDLISLNKLETKADIPQGTLSKAILGHRAFPLKHLEKLEQILTGYGYKKK